MLPPFAGQPAQAPDGGHMRPVPAYGLAADLAGGPGCLTREPVRYALGLRREPAQARNLPRLLRVYRREPLPAFTGRVHRCVY